METFEEIINQAQLDENEKLLLADTINYGWWGDCDMDFKEDGETIYDRANGFITNDAHEGGHFERKKLPALFKKMYKKLPKNVFKHISDWWEDGSGDVLFVREFSEEFLTSMYDWAKSPTKKTKKSFSITCLYTTSADIIIEAENEDEERMLAWESIKDHTEKILQNLNPVGLEIH